jgi:hypothetical protein
MTIPHIGYTEQLHSGAVTADGNTQSSPVETKYVKEAIFFLDITAISGTLDLEIQTYNPLTENWHKLATFDQKNGIGQDEGFIEYGLGERIALEYKVSGSATFTLDAHLK